MQRRNFIKNISAASAISFVPFKNFGFTKDENNLQTLKPNRFKKGDTIGLIAPASFITEDELKESIKNLESLEFKVAYTKNILAKYGYLAGTDEQRASDVNEMFERKDIDGIVCARGGYGCARILPLLNYELIKNNPKILIGYSDVTALLYGIYKKTGLVCFHGPVGISTFNNFSTEYFNDVLIYPHSDLTLFNSDEDKEDDEFKVATIRSGSAKGKLVGGNLSIVVSLIGTPYDIESEGKIIFLEEIGEEPYRIDRMLTQMIQAGKFNNAAGIALGVFKNSKSKEEKSGIASSFTLNEVLFDRLSSLKIPVLYGLSFGHITNKFTLPFGIEAELNSISQTLKLLEPAVI
ncbi:MAG: LD-carboxypeptidase [Ignavibacteriaceae bacterium]